MRSFLPTRQCACRSVDPPFATAPGTKNSTSVPGSRCTFSKVCPMSFPSSSAAPAPPPPAALRDSQPTEFRPRLRTPLALGRGDSFRSWRRCPQGCRGRSCPVRRSSVDQGEQSLAWCRPPSTPTGRRLGRRWRGCGNRRIGSCHRRPAPSVRWPALRPRRSAAPAPAPPAAAQSTRSLRPSRGLGPVRATVSARTLSQPLNPVGTGHSLIDRRAEGPTVHPGDGFERGPDDGLDSAGESHRVSDRLLSRF